VRNKNPISIDLLRNLLRYEPETGNLFWLARISDLFTNRRACNAWNARYATTQAFTALSDGYRHGTIMGKTYKASRVIWALVHGYWPNKIDHENQDRLDNKLTNLRDISALENSKNQRLHKDNKSGVAGVRWQKDVAKWVARIGGKNRIYLGCFVNKDDAIEARKASEIKYGFHPNHGKPVPQRRVK
jgi:hypothetical protein